MNVIVNKASKSYEGSGSSVANLARFLSDRWRYYARLWIIAVAGLLVLPGCLDFDRLVITYEIDSKLKGSLTLQFLNIHGTVDEMQRFYKNYKKDGADIAREWQLKDHVTILHNKSDVRTDGRIVAKVDHLGASLLQMPMKGDANIQQNETTFTFTWILREKLKANEHFEFAVRYKGRVLSHNAHSIDGTGALRWDMQRIDEHGLEFTLALQ